ncbi:MAG TPA: hypothetical protein VFK41_12790 [Nocardioidaceae bacterium]|nr:hypothetical protein [Nocardioidaceae bacterium]
MLQIVTKMYFAPDASLHISAHRVAVHTNLAFLGAGRDRIELPVGTLIPESGLASTSTVMIEVVEHLEKELDEAGASAGLVSTGGAELVDDLAAVMAFGLDAVFHRREDVVQRLCGEWGAPLRRGSAGSLLSRTFEPQRFVQDADLEALSDFMTDLLALERPSFERAMRAIRHVVRATQNAVDDPTGAYTEMVEGLESLADADLAPAIEWDRYDGRKRTRIDASLDGLDLERADAIRKAVLEADQIGATSLFVHSTIARLGEDYFRAEASGTKMPLRRPDLELALKLAYQTRSQKSHVLRDLPPEVFLFSGSETHDLIDGSGTMLTLEGLWRLVRHVIRKFVAYGPKGVDATFNWRRALPGRATVRWAPQYWIADGASFSKENAPERLAGLAEVFVETIAERGDGVPNMTDVLVRIEELVPGLAKSDERTSMIAIYWMWHRLMAPQEHRPEAQEFLEKHSINLDPPSIITFLASNASGAGLPDWTTDEYLALAEARHADRSRRRHFRMPAQFDAALHLETADLLEADGRHELALRHAAWAVEELPGNEMLIGWEARLRAGQHGSNLPMFELIFGVDHPDAKTETEQAQPENAEEGGS